MPQQYPQQQFMQLTQDPRQASQYQQQAIQAGGFYTPGLEAPRNGGGGLLDILFTAARAAQAGHWVDRQGKGHMAIIPAIIGGQNYYNQRKYNRQQSQMQDLAQQQRGGALYDYSHDERLRGKDGKARAYFDPSFDATYKNVYDNINTQKNVEDYANQPPAQYDENGDLAPFQFHLPRAMPAAQTAAITKRFLDKRQGGVNALGAYNGGLASMAGAGAQAYGGMQPPQPSQQEFIGDTGIPKPAEGPSNVPPEYGGQQRPPQPQQPYIEPNGPTGDGYPPLQTGVNASYAPPQPPPFQPTLPNTLIPGAMYANPEYMVQDFPQNMRGAFDAGVKGAQTQQTQGNLQQYRGQLIDLKNAEGQRKAEELRLKNQGGYFKKYPPQPRAASQATEATIARQMWQAGQLTDAEYKRTLGATGAPPKSPTSKPVSAQTVEALDTYRQQYNDAAGGIFKDPRKAAQAAANFNMLAKQHGIPEIGGQSPRQAPVKPKPGGKGATPTADQYGVNFGGKR